MKLMSQALFESLIPVFKLGSISGIDHFVVSKTSHNPFSFWLAYIVNL